MARRQSSLSILLRVKAKGFDAALSRAGKSLQKFGGKAQAAGKNLTRSLTAPLAGLATIAGKTAVDFEFALAKVAAVGGFTAQEMGKLESQAKTLGATTSKSASEVAGLQLELAKLGQSQAQIENMTEGILSLGIAFDEDLGDVAAEVGATLNRFGLDSSQTNRVVDVMAKAFGSSALDLEKFGNAMAKAGPTSSALGVSLEDTTAALGVLVNNGIDASTAGTALTKAMTTLAKKGVEPSEILGTLFGGSLDVAQAFELFGDRAGKIIPVLQASGDQFAELSTKVNESEGAAAAARATLENTTKGAIDRMKSALEAAALSLSEFLLPAIKKLADFVAGAASAFANLDSESKGTVVRFAAIAAAAGPALLLFGKFSSVLGTVLRFLPLITGPVGLIGAAIAAAAFLIITNWSSVVAYFQEGPGRTFLDVLISNVENIMNAVVSAFNQAVGFVTAFWSVFGDDIVSIATSLVNNVGESFGFLFDGIGSLFASFTALFNGDWTGFLENLANAAASILQFLVNLFFTGVTAISGIVDSILSQFGVDSGITEGIEKAQDFVVGFLEESKVKVEETEDSVWSLGDAFKRVGEIASGFTAGGGGGGGGTVSTGGSTSGGDGGDGSETLDPDAVETYNGLLMETKTLGEQAGDAVGQSMAQFGSSIADAIVEGESFGDAMKNVFKSLLKQLLGLAISYFIASALSPLAPENLLTAGSAGASKAAGASGFVASLFSAIPKFAKGGAVTGPTLAMIGERPGSRGEFVIPFERMGQFLNMAGGGGSQVVNGRISGNDILLTTEKAGRNMNRRRIV